MNNSNKKFLYLPSTPLNLIIACSHAVNNSDCQSRLWLIDQESTNNPYTKALKQWKNSPFIEIKSIVDNSTGLSKILSRKKNFKIINKSLKIDHPFEIFVGSDRRIDFQYIYYFLSKYGNDFTTSYLDDGLFSYLEFPKNIISQCLSSIIKKVFYGFWWEEPKFVGSSTKIKNAYLFSPENAIPSLKTKKHFKIKPTIFKNPKIQELSQLILKQYGINTKLLSSINSIILLAHPSQIKQSKEYKKNILLLTKKISKQGLTIFIKYHPRHKGNDPLNFSEQELNNFIPSHLGIEFLLPTLAKNTLIMGDFSTALLTCKWIRPDIRTIAFLAHQHPKQKLLTNLTHKFKIETVENIDDINF